MAALQNALSLSHPQTETLHLSFLENEQRVARRQFVIAPASAVFDGKRHVALVRDVSGSGLFFYSDFKPACGDAVQLTIKFKQAGSKVVTVACRGKVARVEAANSYAAVGVGLKVENYDLGESDSIALAP